MPLGRLRAWAHAIRRDLVALYLIARNPRAPWPARLLILLLLAYALSPIDLIPDFVPVLGYLDDLILLPLGVLLVIWLLPSDLMAAARAEAERHPLKLPRSRAGALAIVLIWLGALIALLRIAGLF